MSKYGFIGLGLIGGSLCKALKKYTTHYVVGCDINHDIEFAALRDVAIDEEFNGVFSGFDIVIMSLFPEQTESWLNENISRLDKIPFLDIDLGDALIAVLFYIGFISRADNPGKNLLLRVTAHRNRHLDRLHIHCR